MKKVKGHASLPLQVYLDNEEQRRLERLATQLDTTKSDVVRRGISALERQILSPESHPALRVIGLAEQERDGARQYDAATEHDRALADDEQASWRPVKPKRRRRA